ncbi:hypothetical protein LguiA_001636 [Lonicera macranthoides]
MFSPPSEDLCRRFSLLEILAATNNFDNSMVIGKGGFGTVYKGDIIDNDGAYTTVAFKRLNPLSKQGAPEFWTEINMLSNFRHSHLVSLIGYCDHHNEMIIVYEYMVRGTLADHLYKISRNNNRYYNNNNIGNSSPLSWVQRLKICIGAARGLDYLHTGTAILQRVIHRDVKSSNILLDENWEAKISDFGLSRIGPAEQEVTHVSTAHIAGTFGYMDPDYFLTRRFTRKSDVYAFGVVLLEVLCERPALDRSLDEDQWGLARWGQQCIKEGASHQIIGPNLKWEIKQNSLTEFVQIADQCLHSSPKQRPTMSEVVARLELALALQLRSDLVIEEYFFDTSLPANDQENADSHPEDDHFDKVVQLGDSSSGQFFQLGDPVGVGKAVAIKRLRRESMQGLAEGLMEIEILGKFSHPNIVKLLGYYRGEDEEFLLVYEYIQNGSFDRHLFTTEESPVLECELSTQGAKSLQWDTRLKIAVGAARGLSFLHATENQIIVRDVQTKNILLDGDFNAKLSGFGCAKGYPEDGESHVSTRVIGTFGYAAPEYMATELEDLRDRKGDIMVELKQLD